MPDLKEYLARSGATILYCGNPDTEMLERLSEGPGDIWHSSFEQGYKNAFQELVYQTAVFFWYINDFDNLDEGVSWRINPAAFAVRKEVWDIIGGFDPDFTTEDAAALDFGFRAIRYFGAVPLYCKGLFKQKKDHQVVLSREDRHIFYRKNFKADHAIYMIYRLGLWKISEWRTFLSVKKKYATRPNNRMVSAAATSTDNRQSES